MRTDRELLEPKSVAPLGVSSDAIGEDQTAFAKADQHLGQHGFVHSEATFAAAQLAASANHRVADVPGAVNDYGARLGIAVRGV